MLASERRVIGQVLRGVAPIDVRRHEGDAAGAALRQQQGRDVGLRLAHPGGLGRIGWKRRDEGQRHGDAGVDLQRRQRAAERAGCRSRRSRGAPDGGYRRSPARRRRAARRRRRAAPASASGRCGRSDWGRTRRRPGPRRAARATRVTRGYRRRGGSRRDRRARSRRADRPTRRTGWSGPWRRASRRAATKRRIAAPPARPTARRCSAESAR